MLVDNLSAIRLWMPSGNREAAIDLPAPEHKKCYSCDDLSIVAARGSTLYNKVHEQSHNAG